jgi:hypothetical protein
VTFETLAGIIGVHIGAGSRESHCEQRAKVPSGYATVYAAISELPLASCVSWKRPKKSIKQRHGTVWPGLGASPDESHDLGRRHLWWVNAVL